jgi:hypothetical protein
LNELATFNFGANVPAHLRRHAAVSAHQSILSNLPTGSWQKISYAGSKWALISAEGDKTYTGTMELDVILVRANPNISKRYYEGEYDPNKEGTAPDCWADNGQGPGDRVPDPVSKICATCDLNKWGSNVGVSGKPTKACSDVKRMAVLVFAPNKAGGERKLLPGSWELDVPGASLKNLAAYAKETEANGAAVTMVVTRLTFVPEANFPQFAFRALDWVSQAEDAAAQAAYQSDVVLLQIGLQEAGGPVQQAEQPRQVGEVGQKVVEQLTLAFAPAPTRDPAPAPQAATTPVAPTCPPGVDPAQWAQFQAMQAQAMAAAAQHLPSQQASTTVQEAPRRRGRPPRNPEAAQAQPVAASQTLGVFATQPATNAYSGGVAATQPLPAQTNGSLPASQAVVLNPQPTSAAIDEILKGIPGLS